MIDSDDLSQHGAQERARHLLTNHAVNEIARAARSFRPVEGDTGAAAADVFVSLDSKKSAFVAVFNYSANERVTITVALERLGLARGITYQLRDLWTQREFEARDHLSLDLAPGESTILSITAQ